MKLVYLLLVMIPLSISCGRAQSGSDEDQLLAIERGWNDALRTHNVRWFQMNLAEDLTDIGSLDGVLRTKKEDLALMETDKTTYESLELTNLRARVEGNAGIVTGINYLRGRDENGHGFDLVLAFTDTYIKRDGRWQVWASQHTRIPKSAGS